MKSVRHGSTIHVKLLFMLTLEETLDVGVTCVAPRTRAEWIVVYHITLSHGTTGTHAWVHTLLSHTC